MEQSAIQVNFILKCLEKRRRAYSSKEGKGDEEKGTTVIKEMTRSKSNFDDLWDDVLSKKGAHGSIQVENHTTPVKKEQTPDPAEIKSKLLDLQRFFETNSGNSDDILELLQFFDDNAKEILEKWNLVHVVKSLVVILLQGVRFSFFMDNSLHLDVSTKLKQLLEAASLYCKTNSLSYGEMSTLMSKAEIQFASTPSTIPTVNSFKTNFCCEVELFGTMNKRTVLDEILQIEGLWPYVKNTKRISDSPLAKINIVKFSDHLHFWATFGENFSEKVSEVEFEMHRYQQVGCVKFLAQPKVGDIVGYCQDNSLKRTIVLQVEGFFCNLLDIDSAEFHKAVWFALFVLPKHIQDIPPLIKLCQIKGVVPQPDIQVIIKCLQLLQKLCSFRTKQVFETVRLNQGSEILCQLATCPKDSIKQWAVHCILHLMEDPHVRNHLLRIGFASNILEILKYSVDLNSECLHERNEMLGLTFQICCKCIADNADPGIVALFASPEVVFMTEEILRKAKTSSVLLRRYAYQFLRSVPYRTEDRIQMHVSPRRFENQATNPLQKPKMISITDDITFEEKVNQTKSDSQFNNPVPAPEQQMFHEGMRLQLKNDETTELRPTSCILNISVVTLSKIICSLMNTGKDSAIYFGLNQHAFVVGIVATRGERDAMRVGLDRLVSSDIVPNLNYMQFGVTFTPVLARSPSSQSREPFSKFVIEIRLRPNADVLYKLRNGDLYLHRGDETLKACSADLRIHMVKKTEAKYGKKISLLKSLLNKTT